MNNNIQCSIESSTTKIELNSAVEGVFLVPELEGLAGLPEIRTTSGVNAGYDGGWTSAQNYDARLISIRGVIANPDISKVEDKRRAIASLLGQGRKEQLTLRFTTEAGNAYAISVRTISCEMALQRVLTTQEFLIQLRADDPLIYDDGTTGGIAAILQPQRALGGFEINFELPLAIGGGAEDTVVDNGNETVYPVIKMYGALHSPTVVNRTTNQQMQILADLQYSIDWHTYRSATGDYILVNDGLNGAPMTLSQLLGNAEQTTYSGKNLFSGNFSQFDNQGGTGTTYAYFKLPTDGLYTLSLKAKNAITASGRYIGFNANGGVVNDGYKWIYQNSAATAGQVFTGTNIYNGVNLGFVFMYPKTSDALQWLVDNFEIQLESGSTRTDYEPYVGGIPAPNPDYPQPISTVTGDSTVVICGKNSLSAPQDYTEDRDGLIFTCTGGVYNISGNASSGNVTADHDITQPYTIREGDYWHLCNDFTETHIQIALVFTDGSIRNYSPGMAINRIESLSAYVGKTVSKIRFYYNPGYNINGNIKPMILNGVSTATDFIPYQGQSYEIKLSQGNLLPDIPDGTVTAAGITTTWSNGTAHITGTNTSTSFNISNTLYFTAPLQVGETYTFSMATTSPHKVVLRMYDTSTQTWSAPYEIAIGQTSATTRLPFPCDRVAIYMGSVPTSGSKDITLSGFRFGRAIELAKIGNYQDRIYKNEGKWYIEKQVGKVVFTGASGEQWGGESYGGYWRVNHTFSDIAPISQNTDFAGLSDYFHMSINVLGVQSIKSGDFCQYRNTSTVYFAPPLSVQSSSDWRTWLSTHNTTVYYALATPTTTEITDETLLLQLNFLASLYGGENNISLIGTGVQGEMVISYATDYTVNQDIITIDSQARTITLNGQDVYHLKTSESEFLVLAPGENKLYLTSEVSDDSGYAEVKFKQGYLSI